MKTIYFLILEKNTIKHISIISFLFISVLAFGINKDGIVHPDDRNIGHDEIENTDLPRINFDPC